jgi:hypothetical protein
LPHTRYGRRVGKLIGVSPLRQILPNFILCRAKDGGHEPICTSEQKGLKNVSLYRGISIALSQARRELNPV